ncbi:unnamed protein product [Alopecurus aequalis]
MARCSRALFLALLLIAGALIQSSCASRPSPREPGVLLDVDGGVESELTKGAAVAQQVLTSNLPRRILEGGVTAEDSAARSSCRSSDPHVTCPPPALH